ncbi:MAG TPA: hypothetical protein VF861_14440 [Telluria sp.]
MTEPASGADIASQPGEGEYRRLETKISLLERMLIDARQDVAITAPTCLKR